MTYAFAIDMPGSLELYRTAHAEFNKYPTDELLVHLARPTDGGVQIVECGRPRRRSRSWMATSGRGRDRCARRGGVDASGGDAGAVRSRGV